MFHDRVRYSCEFFEVVIFSSTYITLLCQTIAVKWNHKARELISIYIPTRDKIDFNFTSFVNSTRDKINILTLLCLLFF